MKNNFLQEVLISGVLIVLLTLFLNPFELWMPPILLMMMILGLIVAFSLFASFIWRENNKDEREGLHKLLAGRAAFLSGTAMLVVAIIVQSLQHELDVWLVFTLGVMILAKIGALLHGRIHY